MADQSYFRIGFQESSHLLACLCLCSVERRRKECREIIEGAGKLEEEFYLLAELFFDRIGAQVTRLVARENYPILLAIRVAAGYHPNST